jgi:hypothetical protein
MHDGVVIADCIENGYGLDGQGAGSGFPYEVKNSLVSM